VGPSWYREFYWGTLIKALPPRSCAKRWCICIAATAHWTLGEGKERKESLALVSTYIRSSTRKWCIEFPFKLSLDTMYDVQDMDKGPRPVAGVLLMIVLWLSTIGRLLSPENVFRYTSTIHQNSTSQLPVLRVYLSCESGKAMKIILHADV
jgi:hypothetical protein